MRHLCAHKEIGGQSCIQQQVPESRSQSECWQSSWQRSARPAPGPPNQSSRRRRRKSRPRYAQARSPQKRPLRNSLRLKLREKLHPVSVKHQSSTCSHPTKEKPETESSSPEPTSARQPVYEASPSARVTQLSFNRPTTASPRPCQAAERRAWSSSPSPPPREKTQDRSL